MKTGIFLDFEDRSGRRPQAAFDAQIRIAQAGEALGFDTLWVSEHHRNAFSLSGAMFPLLAYLAAATNTIGLGSAAAVLPWHHPALVAEAAATIDVLSRGRFTLGVARGGPFSQVYDMFGTDETGSTQGLLDALDVVDRLLHGHCVSATSQGFRCDNALVFPRPLQEPLPIYVASTSAAAVRLAAERGFGLMAGMGTPVSVLTGMVNQYRAQAGSPPRLQLIADCLVAASDDQARALATPFLQSYGDLVRSTEPWLIGLGDVSCGTSRELSSTWIGSPRSCVERLQALLREVEIEGLILKLNTFDTKIALDCLHRVQRDVLPALATHLPLPTKATR
jgi:alkanesulfonate monooxygenase SsuD/methylene tetrahydromethanopterin reductase-like flavin-dependent oxidoreductase (luciferase family)